MAKKMELVGWIIFGVFCFWFALKSLADFKSVAEQVEGRMERYGIYQNTTLEDACQIGLDRLDHGLSRESTVRDLFDQIGGL